ncbi:unnamed protein product [Urochloa humidicola]
MGRKKKRCCSSYKHWSSSSGSSSSDDISIDETTHTTRPIDARRNNNGKKEDEVISMLTKLMDDTRKLTESHNDLCNRLEIKKDDTIEIRKQLDKLTESHRDQCQRLEKFAQSHNDLLMQLERHANVKGGDKSAALRSQLSNQVQTPRYGLVFKNWKIDKYVEKDHNLEISIALVEKINGQTVESGPLASATVELVVVDAQFNKHGNQYSWSREEFESSIIKKAQQGNLAMRDVDQPSKSIVSNGQFNLAVGFKSHSDSTIFCNSSNKKIRLGVMVVSPTEERVLEGLSNSFYVRGHDRPARQPIRSNRRTQALVDNGHQEQNGTMQQLQNPSSSANSTLAGEISPVIIEGQLQHPFQQEQSALTQQYQGVAQATNNQTVSVRDYFTGLNAADSFFCEPGNELLTGLHALDSFLCDPGNGTQFDRNERAFPVHLIWDRPNVEPSKHHWNMLDQLMPPYSCQPKFNKWIRLTSEHFGSLTIVSKEAMQNRRQGGVLIESLDPDDSDEELPLKRKLHNGYRLRFVNKVSEAYYTWEQIKSYDGKLLKVALFDENNTRITSGPLSSASVEVVALHGDFDVHGQDYWTPEEFSRCVVCPRPGKEASVLGGDRSLVLADGEACLGETFFQRTSFCARTGMFKLGVMLASAQAERIQEGISKPFLVNDRPLAVFGGKDTTTHKGLPLEFPFCHHAAVAAPFSVPIIPQDVYKSDPLYIPAKAMPDDHSQDLFCSQELPTLTCARDFRRLYAESNRTTLDGQKLGRDEDPAFIPVFWRPINKSPLAPSSPDFFPVLPSTQISNGGKSEASGSSAAENENNVFAASEVEMEELACKEEETEIAKADLMEEEMELAAKAEELARKEEIRSRRVNFRAPIVGGIKMSANSVLAAKVAFVSAAVAAAASLARLAVPQVVSVAGAVVPRAWAVARFLLVPPYLFVTVHLIILVIWKLSDHKHFHHQAQPAKDPCTVAHRTPPELAVKPPKEAEEEGFHATSLDSTRARLIYLT